MRKLLIKILFQLLKLPKYDQIDDEKILEWLARQRTEMGFARFYEKRSLQILKTLGSGLSRENYLMWLRQRLELLTLLEQMKKAEEVIKKRSEQKKKK